MFIAEQTLNNGEKQQSASPADQVVAPQEGGVYVGERLRRLHLALADAGDDGPLDDACEQREGQGGAHERGLPRRTQRQKNKQAEKHGPMGDVAA